MMLGGGDHAGLLAGGRAGLRRTGTGGRSGWSRAAVVTGRGLLLGRVPAGLTSLAAHPLRVAGIRSWGGAGTYGRVNILVPHPARMADRGRSVGLITPPEEEVCDAFGTRTRLTTPAPPGGCGGPSIDVQVSALRAVPGGAAKNAAELLRGRAARRSKSRAEETAATTITPPAVRVVVAQAAEEAHAPVEKDRDRATHDQQHPAAAGQCPDRAPDHQDRPGQRQDADDDQDPREDALKRELKPGDGVLEISRRRPRRRRRRRR